MQAKDLKEKIRKKEESLREMWDIIKLTNIHVMGIPEEEERKKMKKTFEEITV